MKRFLVDLRVLIVVVVALGAALAVVSVELVGVYNAPVQHTTDFYGLATAKVINYSTIVGRQNFTITGIPAGALLGLNWDFAGPGGSPGVTVYAGPNPNSNNAQVCDEGPQSYYTGSCSWTGNGQSLTVTLSTMTSAPPVTSANYTAEVIVQGWYVYTSPAI